MELHTPINQISFRRKMSSDDTQMSRAPIDKTGAEHMAGSQNQSYWFEDPGAHTHAIMAKEEERPMI